MNMLITLLVASMGFLMSGQDGLDNAFAKANKAYTAEKYDIAIAGYELILKSDVHSAEVYFNLANAHYKLNHIAPAIYNYEKALQLDPSNADFKTNLGYANQMKLDKIEALPKDGFKESFKNFVKSYDTDSWAYFSLVVGLFTVLMFVFYFYAQVAGKKRLFFIISLVGILFTFFFIYTAFVSKNMAGEERFAIIFAPEVEAKIEPRANAEAAFTIHEGTKVQLLEKLDNWTQIQLENGNKAWMPIDGLKEL